MTPERLADITRAAQEEAEREYPTQETTDPRDIELFHALNLERLALRAAHLKCAVASAIRAEGLVEALNALRMRLENKAAMHLNKGPDGRPQWSMTQFTHEQYSGNWDKMKRLVESALSTYTNTNSPSSDE